jgi:predicted nuclease of restriction endonuclease-like (RecB) superfamily
MEVNSDYLKILKGLKEKIIQTRQWVSLSANAQLLFLYWEIGKSISVMEGEQGWGTKIVEKLSIDLKTSFPEMKGLSPRNLRYMRDFSIAYPQFTLSSSSLEFLQQPAAKTQNTDQQTGIILQQAAAKLDTTSITNLELAQIPWSDHQVLLDKVKDAVVRTFYIRQIIKNGWSRNVLVHQITGKLFQRQGKALSNFELTLPNPQSDLATETLKNPYLFDFLNLDAEAREREVEAALIQHIRKFLLELGRGFAYVGNQFNLNVAGDDFFTDLLFFNFHLNCFVVFELKVGDFQPEFAGKLNFYINSIDEQIKGKEHNPTIGVLLCKTPNQTVIKYSLKSIGTPIGVADYELRKSLPKKLAKQMPTIEELEEQLEAKPSQISLNSSNIS